MGLDLFKREVWRTLDKGRNKNVKQLNNAKHGTQTGVAAIRGEGTERRQGKKHKMERVTIPGFGLRREMRHAVQGKTENFNTKRASKRGKMMHMG